MGSESTNSGHEESLLLKRAITFQSDSIPYAHPVPPPLKNNTIVKMWGDKPGGPSHKISESLDYEPVQNNVFQDRIHAGDGKKKIYGYTGHTLAKFVVTFATGIITGLFAVALTKSTTFLIDWKNGAIQELLLGGNVDNQSVLLGFLMYSTYGGVMVQYWAPAAAGAGGPMVHIKAFVASFITYMDFVWRKLKYVSLLAFVQGPMVHIGACVASFITYMDFKLVTKQKLVKCIATPTPELQQHSNTNIALLSLANAELTNGNDTLLTPLQEKPFTDKLKVLDEITSDNDHREFVSAGVSAGISAAFGAPIGGVLFSMEEACSFWSRKTAWRCFIAATLSTYTIQLLNNKAVHGMLAFNNLVGMENEDWLMQLPLLLINFIVAGLLGATFNSIRMWLWTIRAGSNMHVQRIAEVLGLVWLCGACGFFFAASVGKCKKIPLDW
eukprot:gene1152-3717_t